MIIPNLSRLRFQWVLIILTSLGVGVVHGQSSHRDLTSELVKDLAQAILDTTTIAGDGLHFEFTGDSPRSRYLNSCIPESFKVTQHDSLEHVEVIIEELVYIIKENSGNRIRNSSFHRSLELEVNYEYAGEEHSWQGRISDNLSKVQLRSLLTEPYPLMIRGDHKRSQPRIFIIILTTLGVFSLGAALFFIRT